MNDVAWHGRLRALKREALTVWCVARHPRLPWAVRGLALGVAAHGIGTARAFQIDEETGAFAGLAMGLTALFSALVLPWLAAPLLRWL